MGVHNSKIFLIETQLKNNLLNLTNLSSSLNFVHLFTDYHSPIYKVIKLSSSILFEKSQAKLTKQTHENTLIILIIIRD